MAYDNKSHGLTTTKAPFIEKVRHRGKVFIHQPYELYNQDNHLAWQKLYALLLPKWEQFANEKFMEGVKALCLNPSHIPRLEDINTFLEPLSGFKAKAVSGYVPTFLFFDSLKNREFPTTITIRDSQRLNYLPEPDIFHDIAGHVPMHTDRTFADILVKLGTFAKVAAERHAISRNYECLINNIRALSRFFWFTIEFGLMHQNGKLCVYGSGLLSSFDEIEHAIVSKDVQKSSFVLEWVIHQSFEINQFQNLLFVIESFEHLYEQVELLEKWLTSGKLDHVSKGTPNISAADLNEFLNIGFR